MPEFGRTSPLWMLEVSELALVESSCRRTYDGFDIAEKHFLSADKL